MALQDRGISSLLITHTNKSVAQNGVFRVEGSYGGFVGRARVVLGIGMDEETGLRGVGVLKSNLGPTDVPVVAFRIDENGDFHWQGETMELTTQALFNPPASDEDRTAMDEARDAIIQALTERELTPQELTKATHEVGCSSRTVERARKT